MDGLVCAELYDTAAAHMTENGEIKHRLLEIRMPEGPVGYLPNKSAQIDGYLCRIAGASSGVSWIWNLVLLPAIPCSA
jgi:hypothetical protein